MSNKYTDLRAFKREDPQGAQRCAARLLAIRERLADLRRRKNDGSLLLATWNIRDFDSNKFGYGPRLRESFYYIAEIMSCFDLISVQEVNRDLTALEKLMQILGREWDYIATDSTEGAGGNNERMAFVYNKEKVWFRKIAGEIVLPDGQLIVSRKKTTAKKKKAAEMEPTAAAAAEAKAEYKEVEQQFARTPFLVAFQSGWFRFSLCTVHIYYGAKSGPQLDRRIAEIKRLVGFFAKRQDETGSQEKDRYGKVENYILLGDFNVVSPEHKTMAALKDRGFAVPEAIDGKKVRREGDHFYDQIAVRVKDERFHVAGGGLVDMYADVFRDEDRPIYDALLPAKDPETGATMDRDALYRKWRTWQMSDHHPLWIEIATDFTDHYLRKIAQPG